MFAELMMRFFAGGSLIVVISLLAKTKHPMLAGIFMLFPAVTLVGYYFAGPSMGVDQLKHVTLFSVWALTTTFVFLVTFYYAQDRVCLNAALVSATAMWFVASGVLLAVAR